MKRIGLLALCFGVTAVNLCGCANLQAPQPVETSIVYVQVPYSESVSDGDNSQESIESTVAISTDISGAELVEIKFCVTNPLDKDWMGSEWASNLDFFPISFAIWAPGILVGAIVDYRLPLVSALTLPPHAVMSSGRYIIRREAVLI